jgi:hypothetical protein
MKKTILFTTICFLIIGATISCNKSKLKGCNSSTKNFSCTINGADFKADSMGAIFDSITNHIYIYARKKDVGEFNVSLYNNLEDMDIHLKNKDSVYSGMITGIYQGQQFMSTFGNWGMEYESGKACGQFFFQDNLKKFNISVGKFSAIPVAFQ